MLGSMTVRTLVSIALLPILGTVLTACGTASAPSPPAGVDVLVIPTPSPDPADFVDRVDNPWFPLEPGTRRTYDVADSAGTHTLVVTVEPGPTVAGVPTTARVSRERGSRVVDWYAQDDRGDVWWFGQEGKWAAGTHGAEAGLAMAATPRVGDGYRTAYAGGMAEDAAKVLSVTDDEVVVEERSPLRPGTEELTYERSTGLVTDQLVVGAYRVVRLRR